MASVITAEWIADLIGQAPGWALVGLTVPQERLMASVITAERTEGLIGEAPGWALVELTVPKERLRADARREVTRHAYSALYQPKNVEAGQLRCHFKVVDRRPRARGFA